MDWSILVFAFLVLAAAASGAVFKPGAWYEELDKPGWTPPNIAFPIVWSALYLMIGTAGWLVWRIDGFGAAIVIWGAQLALNALWSYLFFGRRRMDLALIDVGALGLAIALFMVVVWPISKAASLLFVPYLVWVCVAGTLNRSVMQRNPQSV